jgi:hypothetical protein
MVTIHALPQLDIEVLPLFRWTTGEPRFVGLGATTGDYVFGVQDATVASLTLRTTYTFSPKLTLQAYAQLFLAAVHYDNFTHAAPREDHTIHLDDLAPVAAPAVNPDYQSAVLDVNVVLRWEYSLGSTLFVVYTRSQQPTAALLAGQTAALDLAGAFRGPAVDVFLVKLSYWWG